MSKHLSIALVVPIIFIVFMYLFNYQIVVNETKAFDDFTKKKLANYAADAAAEELLYTGNLNQDYATRMRTVQPDLAVDEFCRIMLLGLGRQCTDTDIEWYKIEYLKTMVICAYDGFYLYQYMPDTEGDYAFISSPKIPYYYTADDGTQYCLTLGFTDYWVDSIDSDGKYHFGKWEHADGNPPVSETIQLTSINNTVSEYLQYGVSCAYGGHLGKSYELPALASRVSGGQPVNGVTVIGVIDTDTGSYERPNILMSIGGARITDADPVLGFTYDNMHMYCHESKLRAWCISHSYTPAIEHQFNSTYDAAKAGYHMFLEAY